MAIIKEQSKTFPLWFQDETINDNYSDEYKRCLSNLPVDATQGATVSNFATSPTLPGGSNTFEGGIVAPNGKIYFLPVSHHSILIYDVDDNTYTQVAHGVAGTVLFFRGCLAPNGCIYLIPYNSTVVVKIDTNTDIVSTLVDAVPAGANLQVGGVIDNKGCIYSIPHNGTKILKIDTNTDTLSALAGSVAGASGKWACGCLAYNGFIYGIPHNATEVLKIDPSTDTFSLLSLGITGSNKYYSGAIDKNGIIYCSPYNSLNVGRLDTNGVETFDTALTTGVTGQQTGITMAANGKMYTSNYTGNSIEIDPNTNIITSMNALTGYWGTALGLNGKVYLIPRFTTTLTSILDEVESLNDDFCISRFNNKG